MHRTPLFMTVMTAIASALFAGPVLAQSPAEAGRAEYLASCASCHGADGKGQGPVKAFLTTAPTDLTTIAKRNGGAFPEQLVWAMIDGRTGEGAVGPHGTREMPVWGQRYREEAMAKHADASTRMPETQVHQRVMTLVSYLKGIQGR